MRDQRVVNFEDVHALRIAVPGGRRARAAQLEARDTDGALSGS